MRLSEHFDSSEFACHCGCDYKSYGADISPRLIEVLERIRHYIGDIPLEINSGVRCLAHNLAEGGVWNSRHVYGDAADIALPEGLDSTYLADVAEKCGADGIGIYEWGIHIDMRGYPARW